MGNKQIHNDDVQDINHHEWVCEIKTLQKQQEEKLNNIDDDKYSLFISCLALSEPINGYCDISIIARIIRIYVGEVKGLVLYFDDKFAFNGVRISISIHPINAEIYIADERCVYLLSREIDSKTNDFKSKLNVIKKMNKNTMITGISFGQNGDWLACKVYIKDDNNKKKNSKNKIKKRKDYKLQFIDLKSKKYKIFNEEKYASKNIMTLLKYNFNHQYIYGGFVSKILQTHNSLCTPQFTNTVCDSSTLYTLDPYKKEIWFLENDQNKLVKLPYKYFELLSNKTVFGNNKALNFQLDQILKTDQYETIDLWGMFQNGDIIAFDIDKLYGAIYIITSNSKFYRLERNKNMRDDIHPLRQRKWVISHEAVLRDALPLGMPLGICSVSYDSVSGRVIIGDNYKIQALYA